MKKLFTILFLLVSVSVFAQLNRTSKELTVTDSIHYNTGTNGYMLRLNPSKTFVNGSLRDNGTNIGLGAPPSPTKKLYVVSENQYGICSDVTYTFGNSYGIYSNNYTSNAFTNVSAYFTGGNAGTGDAFGVYSNIDVAAGGGISY